ncbi:XdhC family protein [Kiloniella antarctica]|uniref:XdhC family protein n=1 Tax=Kiloniella antarctica TaxID=1550907 RepID=A0ABW5BEX4_9PROT
MKRLLLDQLNQARSEKKTVVLLTNLNDGTQELITPLNQDQNHPLFSDIKKSIRDDRSYVHEENGSKTFIQVFNPPLRLVIVGAVHISQFLVPMAQLAGYEVIVVDPRRAFGNPARFPSCVINNEWPDDAMQELKPDHRTAVVILTHDPKLDDPAIETTLKSDAFYIGTLGSNRTHAKRLERLERLENLERIEGPIGLNIGSKNPAEIAISILASITNTLRNGSSK